MLPLTTPQELPSSIILSISPLNPNPRFHKPILLSPHSLPHHSRFIPSLSALTPLQRSSFSNPKPSHPTSFSLPPTASVSTSVEPLAGNAELDNENWGFSPTKEAEVFEFEAGLASTDLKHLDSPPLEVKELEELPEKWRRSRLAWLCKELPAHKAGTLIRILNAQKKWVTQEDATYVAVHCMRIRENETGFRVYKWMMLRPWFRFDFALASKLADYLGRDGKFSKCREIFDDIINQGHVPSELTFHILIIAYLSAPVQGCVDEACSIYNRMIQLGGYRPQLALHNSLFRALVSKPGEFSKHYLKQAEFIFHNLVTSGFEIHRDIYGGLIWLHSYQETIDKERITTIRKEMQKAGIQEGRAVLVSILRACSKERDLVEAERTWFKLVHSYTVLPSQAFVYKMEVHAKVGDPIKSLAIFREMQERLGSANIVAFHKIIEVLSRAQEVELAEGLMKELTSSGLKPLRPCCIHLMNMYFNLNLHDKLEATFSQCLDKCSPNTIVYSIYLDSLVKIGNLEKAEGIFNQMLSSGVISVNSRSCNTILSGYLAHEDYAKAEKIYDLMCQKKYDIDSVLREKLDYVMSLSRKVVEKPISLKLSKEQREILVGFLLGGLRMESDERRKNHIVLFEFNDKFHTHSILRRYIYNQYHEWLHPSCKPSDGNDDIPYKFCTISHSYFGFYVDQFFPEGRPVIPKLIHRWMSPQVLAFWYMYGGHRSSSGDILLKLKGSMDDAERVIRTLKAKSLDCKVRRNGRVFWIGFLGSNSMSFWKLTEPYILDDLKDLLRACGQNSEDGIMETGDISFDGKLESKETASDYSDCENL